MVLDLRALCFGLLIASSSSCLDHHWHLFGTLHCARTDGRPGDTGLGLPGAPTTYCFWG